MPDDPPRPASGQQSDPRPTAGAPALLPLPHPSGQSRWLNRPDHAALLEASLDRLGELVAWAETTTA